MIISATKRNPIASRVTLKRILLRHDYGRCKLETQSTFIFGENSKALRMKKSYSIKNLPNIDAPGDVNGFTSMRT
jgi:hypothetical protein